MEVGGDGSGSGHSLSGGSSSQRCETEVMWGDACWGEPPRAPQLLLGMSASAASVVSRSFLQLACVDNGSSLFPVSVNLRIKLNILLVWRSSFLYMHDSAVWL